MRALLVKTHTGLRGATAADHEAWGKFRRGLEVMPEGHYLRLDWVRDRNGAHHRKFFALLQLVAENSETYNTVEKALVALKLVTGHFEPAIHPETGELIQVPKSISYEKMDQDTFEKFYSAAIDGVLQHILPRLDKAKVDRLVDMIVQGWI
jgi:hypothetical protein